MEGQPGRKRSLVGTTPSLEGAFRCELIVSKDGQLFIHPLQGHSGILINGEPLSCFAINSHLEQEIIVELHEQDRLSLNNVADDAQGPRFTLKVEAENCLNGSFSDSDSEELMSSNSLSGEDSDSSFTHITQPWNSVFNDTVLLSTILSYLPFSSLKIARQVCTHWKQESQKYFLSSSTISLQPSPWVKDWEKEFHQYSELVQGYGHENFKVCYSGHPSDGLVEEDVLVFVKRHAAQFKTLELVILPGRNDFAFLRDILSDPGLPNLSQLSLTLVFNGSDYTTRYWPGGIILPSVKSLVLNFGFDEQPSKELVEFAPNFVNSFPSIEKFSMSTDDSAECVLEKPVLHQFIQPGGPAFANLTQIRLQWATARVMDILIDFPNLLRAIDVQVDRFEVDTARIQNLLDKHCSVLTEFRIAIHCDGNGEGGNHRGLPVGEPALVMPDFPKLKKLSYAFYFGSGDTDADVGNADIAYLAAALELGDVDLLRFREAFLGGSETFQKQFPVLTSLQFVFTQDVEEMFGQLFPAEDGQGKKIELGQITQFRTSFPHNAEKRRNFSERIANLFPNGGTRMEEVGGSIAVVDKGMEDIDLDVNP